MSVATVAKKKLTGTTFGERLRSARENAAMTQAELAERTGVNRVNLNRYENDRVVPQVDTAWKLADALGISLDALRGVQEIT